MASSPETTINGFPPTAIYGRDTAPLSLRFYAGRFQRGETKRWDLAAHLLEEGAAEVERLRVTLAEVHDVLTAGVAETVQRHALLTQKIGEALR
jgi:hypothetical protein